MSNIVILDHPLVKHKLSIMRDKNTCVKDFRECAREVAVLIGYEATKNLETEEYPVETPIAQTTGIRVKKNVSLIPILRAGLGMVDAMMSLIPNAKIGHIGLYRDEQTHTPCEYYCKLPTNVADSKVIVIDPMLATGGSAIDAINFIKKRGATDLNFACIIAAPEGLKALSEAHPDVSIFCGAVDEKLNENAYIVPGLGDAGDRLFGTL